MNVAKGRTITVLDKEGVVFTRVWCIYELHLTFIDLEGEGNEKSQEGEWAVYTANEHTIEHRYYQFPYGETKGEEERSAVGIVSGGTTSDRGNNGLISTEAREKAFPYELIKKSLTIQVEDAKASKEFDRVHILNSIIGNTKEELNDDPPKKHDKYAVLNDSLRGRFASSTASLQGALKEGETEWMNMLVTMSKGTSKKAMEFRFSSGWLSDLTSGQAAQLIAHLPLNMEKLIIWNVKKY